MKKELTQINVKGEITATSNKQSDTFVVSNPRKTAYVKVTDPESKKELEDNGLTEYTSKEDGEKFFIIKLSENVDVWINGENSPLSVSIEDPNFKTTGEVDLALIKGHSKGNDFVRLFAIGLVDQSIEMVEKTNPFA